MSMVELVTFGETMLRFAPPDGDRLETATELDFRTAGAESNVAIAAARLGVDAAWCSKVPNSALGRRVLTELRSHGVQPLVTRSDDHRQGTYYLEHGGEPRGTNVIYDREAAAVTTMTPDALPLEAIGDASYVATTGITPALSEQLRETTRHLLETARSADTTTVFDCNYRSKLWSKAEAQSCFRELFEHVDLLVVPERDARAVLDREGSPEAIAAGLAADHDVDTVVLTRGAEGALAYDSGQHDEQQAIEAETYDPIGTGDAFVGGFLASRIDGDSIERALSYGAATAALKRTIGGDLAVVTPEEVEAVLADGSETIDR
jgi:2-dehydro-3-deoxygluconokinase